MMFYASMLNGTVAAVVVAAIVVIVGLRKKFNDILLF